MATFRPRKTKGGKVRYQAVIQLKGLPIERQTFERKADARRWVNDRERELGRFTDGAGRGHGLQKTVSDLIDLHLEQLKREGLLSHDKRRQHLAWWRERLGALPLARVTPQVVAEHCQGLLVETSARLGRPRSAGTVNRYRSSLSAAFSYATKKLHWLPHNPVRNVSREKEPGGRLRYLSRDERERLLVACRASTMRELEPIVMLALTTGMRRGEILGLRWGDVDRARGLIVIQKTKNNERRSVPIVPALRQLLDRHGAVRRLDSALVFPHPVDQGKPLAIDDGFRAAMKAAEVADFRFHDLRHTAASYLAMSGATTAEIAAVLGHKTLAMVKRYAHLSDQHTGAVVQRMTEKYFQSI